MIKKQQKWIALLVTLTFMWLLQVSTMPLRAEQAPSQSGTAMDSAGPAPSYIEEEGGGGYSVKKKSIVPVILLGVGVVAVAAVLFLVVLKTKYDILGTWTATNTAYSPKPINITFSGTKKSGTLTMAEYIDTGTFTVDGKTVHFEFHAAGMTYNWVYDGQFDSKDKMTGNVKYMVNNVVSLTGTWVANRVAASAATGKLPLVNRPALEPK
jgi:hypothetical protein